MASNASHIPVIDVFAGPGGLGEGFSRFEDESGRRPFNVSLSIEKDPFAYRTLLLRSFFRRLDEANPGLASYYDYVCGASDDALDELLMHHAEGRAGREEVQHLELGPEAHKKTDALIRQALGDVKGRKTRPWVLVGGPPCQAYSLAGRARMRRPMGDAFYQDARHTLYREYLRLIRRHRPTVFVMENVKGILSSQLKSKPIFEQILKDLAQPGAGLRYELFPLEAEDRKDSLFGADDTPQRFVTCSERYGVPQARHRVIILGVLTEDVRALGRQPSRLRPSEDLATVATVLRSMPRLRSGLSARDDRDEWLEVVRAVRNAKWLHRAKHNGLLDVSAKLENVLDRIPLPRAGRGGQFVQWSAAAHQPRWTSDPLLAWLRDPLLDGVVNHEARGHMPKDLHRYLFAACYAAERKKSPRLQDFPSELWPKHRNLKRALSQGVFNDRFRVQLWQAPASTVTSHISKDGHYFIHPDPQQCRSLTVREAARLQTFPDNYFFEGPRTEQYKQVGNAVPPFLAHQIAEVVFEWLEG